MPVYNQERSGKLYKNLDDSIIYKLSQVILAPGGAKNLTKKVKELIESRNSSEHVLDVGCGPLSYINRAGIENIFGIDISHEYVTQFQLNMNTGAVASATTLPFKNCCFDAVWSIGLLHHLSYELFLQACSEMARVCKKTGYLAIIDNVFPKSFLHSPIAAIIRKMDRGKYVRKQAVFEGLVSQIDGDWYFDRFTYAYNGLEGVLAVMSKT